MLGSIGRREGLAAMAVALEGDFAGATIARQSGEIYVSQAKRVEWLSAGPCSLAGIGSYLRHDHTIPVTLECRAAARPAAFGADSSRCLALEPSFGPARPPRDTRNRSGGATAADARLPRAAEPDPAGRRGGPQAGGWYQFHPDRGTVRSQGRNTPHH